MKRYPLRNYNDMAVNNVTTADGQHHTQPDRGAELWAKWRRMRDRNEAVKVYGVGETPSIDKVNQLAELELLNPNT
jgi:hypothetical protein